MSEEREAYVSGSRWLYKKRSSMMAGLRLWKFEILYKHSLNIDTTDNSVSLNDQK